jgi:hypothetical protein
MSTRTSRKPFDGRKSNGGELGDDFVKAVEEVLDRIRKRPSFINWSIKTSDAGFRSGFLTVSITEFTSIALKSWQSITRAAIRAAGRAAREPWVLEIPKWESP